MKRMMVVAAIVVGIAGSVLATGGFYPLTVQERTEFGAATHVLIYDASDFTVSSTNTVQTFTNAIPAKMGVDLIGMRLLKAFNCLTTAGTNTAATGSCLLKIGDGSDDDLFLTSTELASDGSEVWIKYAPENTIAVTVTPAKVVVKGYVGGVAVTNAAGAQINFVTNVTATATASQAAGVLGQKIYTTAGSVIATFTPNAAEALDDNTSGEVRIYLRLWDAR